MKQQVSDAQDNSDGTATVPFRRVTDTRAIAALIAVQTLFGLHYIAAKTIVATIPPRPWALLRAGFAALILLAYTAFRRMPLPKGRVKLLQFAGLGLLGVAINQWMFVEGLSRTTPGHSSLINSSIPVVVLLFAVIAGHERPTPRRLIGVAITILGVLLLIKPEHFDWHAESFRGDLLTLTNGVSYALFLVVGKPVFERERTVPASALLLGLGALWLVPVGAPGLATLDFAAIPWPTWLLAAFIVLGPTIAAYALNTFALRRVESSMVAFFIYLHPLIGAGLSIAFGFERPTVRLFAAAAVVFGGVFLAIRSPSSGQAPPAPTAPPAPPLVPEP